ncbi:MAG: hypothetical protein WC295_00250 [Methanoregula sp.]
MQPLAPEQRDKPGASSSHQSTEEKQRGDVKRAGASARTSEHDRASAACPEQQQEIAARVELFQDRLTSSNCRNPCFLKPPSEKKTFIIAFRWPFRGPNGVK